MITLKGLVAALESIKADGIDKDSAADYLDIDTDQDVDYALIKEALDKVYGAECKGADALKRIYG